MSQQVSPGVNQPSLHVSTNGTPRLERNEIHNYFDNPTPSVNNRLNRPGTPHTFTVSPEVGPSYGRPSSQPLEPLYARAQFQPQFNRCHPTDPNPFHQNQFSSVPFVPTQQQSAARQVIPKELPLFSGDPIDWPLFISSYKHSNEACGYSDSENLLRLQRSLKGAAKESVSSFLLHPSTVPQIISTLQTLYGRPEQIVNNMVTKVRATPAPKAEKLETLIEFGLVVQNLCGHLKAIGMENHLSNPTLLQELVDKLPATIKFSWALYQENLPVVDLSVFGDYMRKVISATSSVTNVCMTVKNTKEEKPRLKEKAYVNAHATFDSESTSAQLKWGQRDVPKSKDTERVTRCPACKAANHAVANCSSFKDSTLDERWKVVKENKLCRRCLVSHNRWPCEGEVCGLYGCTKRHHQLLHYEPASVATTNATVSSHRQPVADTLFKILPVTLYGKNKSVDTYAFLDDGSSVTLVEETIADALGVEGKMQSLCIQWTSGINKSIANARMVKFGISELGSSRRFDVSEVYTVENLGLPQQSLDFGSMMKQYGHFRNLPVKSFQRAVPGLLIGLNNFHLMATTKLREGGVKEPIAAKTRIGWVVCGNVRERTDQFQHRQMHMCAGTIEPNLHEYVREFFSVEGLGVSVAPNLEGIEIQRARRILEGTTVKTTSGKYETGLLWKQDIIEFPDSRPMAERRLKCLEKRLEKDPQLYENVRHQIADYQAKGYIHTVTESEMAEFDHRRTWYLPLGVVLNPNKPGKVRVIWDAAAKVDGVSLNTMLLKGPDLLTPQLSVTFKFREREVAFSGDIQEMFLQIGIRKPDKSALLFLFRNSSSQPMITMVSDVAIFGASCSPAQSQFVKNLNATENEREYPRAAAAIRNRHYVDDYLDSVDTEEEAIELALEVAEVHKKAGFHIRNWVSNRPRLLDAIGEINPATVKDLSLNNQSGFERLLGISWMPEEDVFCFALKLRGALIVQGSDTDEQIPQDIFKAWQLWLQALEGLNDVKIPRCYFPGYDRNCYDDLELHIFVDGSSQAYSAVAYFRVQDHKQIRCSLVASKTKVAPLSLVSIPRLELQAAVIGARLRKTIQAGHSIQIKRTYFWSDSTTVISWIRSDTRRYRQYVAFRVNETLSLSKVEEWQWLGTRNNVADEATKWGKGPSCKPDSRWMQGPAFLYKTKSEWPNSKGEELEGTNEELRAAYVGSHFLAVPIIDVERFSKYERLLRSLAYVYRFQDVSQRQSGDPKELTSEQLQKAEQSLWRLAQSESYPEEVASLKHNTQLAKEQQKALDKSSSIAKLPPVLDEHGVLRVDSRITAADYVAYDTRYPIILPRGHRITYLLLDWYHRKYRHANNETIVNEVRQKFYIAKLRAKLRSVTLNCQWCRVYKSKPIAPRMGQLPPMRVTPFVRPFTFVGIDYFGPYFVKVGRSLAKRWVAVFTCLTIRAIHLEIVFSLTTDSCKKAIRRFISCRGAPQEIYTDNGTNFVGASKELESEIRQINVTMSSTLTDANTKWRFNPPSAPHMGGCWERMVRLVKAALGALPSSRKLDDESFMTLLSEAAHMVNSRPLTYVPLENEEKPALTPNNFLMLSSNGVRQLTKVPVDAKAAIMDSWKLLQLMLDVFWHRWIVKYLPMISRRTKWFQEVPPIKENALVMIADEGVRNQWLRGRVIRTYPGKDGVVRRADVETSSGVLQRPACKLAILDIIGDPEVAVDNRENAMV
ncbi:uncharacterized protein LOC128740123 [Sabethes cyaneus]|uniref:uncharacterized protein LOC128740123 n=1 Tax=Sabethes cyaneus TaxID=53552 RepID=UPI00237E9A08|nr:uncharacterized protein LOC128740123 [Sabethes cyaneus]